jgi:hypothetical protein
MLYIKFNFNKNEYIIKISKKSKGWKSYNYKKIKRIVVYALLSHKIISNF